MFQDRIYLHKHFWASRSQFVRFAVAPSVRAHKPLCCLRSCFVLLSVPSVIDSGCKRLPAFVCSDLLRPTLSSFVFLGLCPALVLSSMAHARWHRQFSTAGVVSPEILRNVSLFKDFTYFWVLYGYQASRFNFAMKTHTSKHFCSFVFLHAICQHFRINFITFGATPYVRRLNFATTPNPCVNAVTMKIYFNMTLWLLLGNKL